MKLSFFLMLTVLALLACNTPQTPEKHTFRCYVRYLEDQAQLRAEATLYGKDSVAETPPGGVLYEGLAMSAPSSQATVYRYQRNGVPGEKAHFSWADASGKKHEFSLPILPLTDFGFGPGSISRQKPDTLRWTGAPLDKGETLVLMWENLANGKTVPMELYGSAAQQEIVFPAAKLAEVSPGQWSFYLVRKKMVKGDAGGVPATGIAEYYTRADTVMVQ